MGIWGHKLFEESGFSDVRGAFKDHIADGRTPAEATRRMVKDWNLSRAYKEGYADFWLSLAAVQWDMGRLTPRVLKMAIKIIDSEFGVNAYGDATPKRIQAQRAGYKAIRASLLREPPPPVHVPRRFFRITDWQAGDLVSYRCSSSRVIYLRVLGIGQDRGGALIYIDICPWRRAGTPSDKSLASEWGMAEIGSGSGSSGSASGPSTHGRLCLCERRAGELPTARLAVVRRGLAFPTKPFPCTIVGGWSRFDEYLKVNFALD